MATRRSSTTAAPSRAPAGTGGHDVTRVMAWIERNASAAVRDGMRRFNLPNDRAYGIAVGALRTQAKRIGRDHALAQALWDTGCYEGRLLAIFVDDPARVTAAQMDRWCRDFDNWGICDTACFALFDQAPEAWSRVTRWAGSRSEFVKRGAFALLWSLSVHDRAAGDAAFRNGLALIEREAKDERHFVKKAINMALRAVGKRNAALHEAALATARRLAASADVHARWIGADALRELGSPSVASRLARKASKHPAAGKSAAKKASPRKAVAKTPAVKKPAVRKSGATSPRRQRRG